MSGQKVEAVERALAILGAFATGKPGLSLAERLSAQDCQLFYQVGLLARRDLPLAPDPQAGFEMSLLRMLAFRPAGRRV